MKRLIVIACIALAGCGAANGLKPGTGASLPPKPYGLAETPTPADLMTASAQARPGRSDELLRKSEARRGDEFELPPPN